MFDQLRNIETAFKHVRLFSLLIILAAATITCYNSYWCYRSVTNAERRIYVLTSGKAIEAIAADRKDNIAVEARDHIKMFHQYFFTLDPDDKAIENNVRQALYLADNSAEKQYADLKENGYYSSIISGNVTQRITVDSIKVDVSQTPYYFRYWGHEKIVRPTATLERSLVTDGYLRSVSQSDNNPHGLLIERWRILENTDLNIEKRN